jgi:hypothetical protein
MSRLFGLLMFTWCCIGWIVTWVWIPKQMNKRLWNWIESYHTPPGTSVPFEMWLMQQRFYKPLSSRSGLIICSTYTQMILIKETCTQIKVSPMALIRWVSPKWDVFKWNFYTSPSFRMLSAYQTSFILNLIIFISKHNHLLDILILFPSSTPSIKDLILVVPTSWD